MHCVSSQIRREIVVWFCGYSCCWRAHRAKMVFLCFRASITVGCLSALIGPDGPSLCLSDLSAVSILSSVYKSSWPTSQQERWRNRLEFQKCGIYKEKYMAYSQGKSVFSKHHSIRGKLFVHFTIQMLYIKNMYFVFEFTLATHCHRLLCNTADGNKGKGNANSFFLVIIGCKSVSVIVNMFMVMV